MYAQLIALTVVFASFMASLLPRLAILQEKDYWPRRITADPRTFRINIFEGLAALSAVLAISALIMGVQTDLTRLLTLTSLINLLNYFISLLAKKYKRPKFTLRLILNLVVIVFAVMLQIFFIGVYNQLILISLTLISPILLVILANYVVRQIAFIGHRRLLKKAQSRLENIPNLKKIGITGSFGKSTTKLFLNKILELEKNVISTPGSINTDIGLAKSINSQLNKLGDQAEELDIAVLEMDSYTRGTLARVTRYFNLDQAVIMSLNEQHLETFGSDFENTKLGNFEMFEGLDIKGENIGIFNKDDQACMELAEWTLRMLKERGIGTPDKNIYTFGAIGSGADCEYGNEQIEHSRTGASLKFTIKFSERLGGEEMRIELGLPAKFFAMNYAAASLIANINGLSSGSIKLAADQVELKRNHLEIYYNKQNKFELINDSFNANPDSVRGNIELLAERNKKFPARNIIVFPGLFDLGEKSHEIHAEIGKLLAKTSDRIIVTNDLKLAELTADLEEESAKNKFFTSPDKTVLFDQLKQEIESTKKENKDQETRVFMINAAPVNIKNYLKSLVK